MARSKATRVPQTSWSSWRRMHTVILTKMGGARKEGADSRGKDGTGEARSHKSMAKDVMGVVAPLGKTAGERATALVWSPMPGREYHRREGGKGRERWRERHRRRRGRGSWVAGSGQRRQRHPAWCRQGGREQGRWTHHVGGGVNLSARSLPGEQTQPCLAVEDRRRGPRGGHGWRLGTSRVTGELAAHGW